MASLSEILELENNREADSSWRIIHLHKDGKFYRAYQVSAWLYSCAINQYKVTHRRFKSVSESVLFIGFPVESLLKWIPENFSVADVADNQIKIELPDDALANICGDHSPKEVYEMWKSQHPMTEDKDTFKTEDSRRGTKTAEPKKAHPAIFSLMQQILAFPIESKSPMECMLFLADMKKTLAEHF